MVNLAKIRGCMAEKRHSQKDVAKILKLSPNSVNNKLLGKTSFTSDELEVLAETYNQDISVFFK